LSLPETGSVYTWSMRKITIIGCAGSGKSTLAVRLGELLRLPVHHLDSLYWKPGWVRTEKPQWSELQHTLCERKQWIIDGNYASTMDIRLNACDTVIFLDVNHYVCLYRAIKRTVTHLGRSRVDMGEGCNERFDAQFAKWIYGYPSKQKPVVMQKLSALSKDVEVRVLKNQREIESFLGEVANKQ